MTKRWNKKVPVVGDEVSYNNVGMWRDRGIVAEIGPTSRGGDCMVNWKRFDFQCEECLRNLIVWEEPE